MADWEFLIDEAALASVLPDEYAHYRPPIRGALAVFLDGLPPEHQASVLADQAALPLFASGPERLARLAASCPALHKLGQVVARDRRLAAELRRHLQDLESLPPSVPVETIRATLAHDLGPLDPLGVTLLPPALAEASVAVVIPFRYEPAGGPPRDGVFKVLKPGIEARLEGELRLLETVGAFLDLRCDEFNIPHLDYREAFEQVRDKLRHEIRLDLEQRQLADARAFYADDPRVQIPAVIPELCTPRVTAMERVRGAKVTDHRLVSDADRRRLAALVVAALISRPIFARTEPAPFHGDPHAGNVFFTDDGRLALLDWSLVGTLGERERAALVQVLLGAVTLDVGHVVTVLAGLAEPGRFDRSALEVVVRDRLRRLRHGEFPGYAWLMGLLDEAVSEAKLRVGADLMLFRKTLHTLDGLLADVGGGDDPVQAVIQTEFLVHLAAEWPFRWLAPPGARAFATRLSNADLVHPMLTLPWTVTRFWLETDLDLLTPDRGVVP